MPVGPRRPRHDSEVAFGLTVIKKALWNEDISHHDHPAKVLLSGSRCPVLLGVPSAAHANNDAVRCNSVLLEAIRTTAFPPVHAARAFAIVHTCMYDAWAAYDDTIPGA